MKVKLADVNAAALDKLPARTDDKSGIGVHYVDAFLKPLNTTLDDGTVVTCKRRGLKVLLAVGEAKGTGLIRRLVAGPDPIAMLDAALQEAAADAGLTLTIEDGTVYKVEREK